MFLLLVLRSFHAFVTCVVRYMRVYPASYSCLILGSTRRIPHDLILILDDHIGFYMATFRLLGSHIWILHGQ